MLTFLTPEQLTAYVADLTSRIERYQQQAESDGLDSSNFYMAAGLAEAKQVLEEMRI